MMPSENPREHSVVIEPRDEHNQLLVARTHPPAWKNPSAKPVYNMVAIGGGTAGIIAALGAAGLGATSALVEKHLLGGDCLNFGCVPSKALLASAQAAYDVRHTAHLGVNLRGEVQVDFAAVMQRLRARRAAISEHDSAERFTKLGVDVHLGGAKFTSPETIEVGGQTLRFRRACIATGGRAAIPEIAGLRDVGYLTNETVFSLTELPQRLLVVGGGPIGCELAQAFARLGSRVTIVQRPDRLLPHDEPDASAIVAQQFAKESITVYTACEVARTSQQHGAIEVELKFAGGQAAGPQKIVVDKILIAAGRQPNVADLGLEVAGVKYTSRGIEVNDFLQTSNPKIYASGDVIGRQLFTHAADAMSRAVLQNAFFLGSKRLSQLVIPRCTYTDPEIASIGLTASQLSEKNIPFTSYREEITRNDRAALEGDTQGFALVHCAKGTGKVLGATIVARNAGDMIGELSLLVTQKLPLGTLASVVHCYPTQIEMLKRLGDQFNKTRLTPSVAWLLKSILRWR